MTHRLLYLAKFWFLTNPIFRIFNRVVYIDADTVVNSNIALFFELDIPPHITILMRDNGYGVNKGDLYSNEYSRNVPVKNTKSPGTSCLMIINMSLLPSPNTMDLLLRNLLEEHHRAFKYADQGLINMAFRDHYMVFWPCTNGIALESPDNAQVKKGWAFALCTGADLIVGHDWEKKCMSTNAHSL